MGKKKRNASQLAKSNKYQKRQQRYFSKKKNEKMKDVPSKMSLTELENWKKYLEPMVEEANKRIELIKASGYTSYALDRVEKEGGRDYFDLTEQCEKSRASNCVMLACKQLDARLFSYGEAAKRDEAKRNRAWALRSS